MVGGNGSYVEDAGEVVLHQTLTGQECRAIVDWLHERHLEFYLEANAGLFAQRQLRGGRHPGDGPLHRPQGAERADQRQ